MIKTQELIAKVLQAYENYEFHVVFHSIHKFCVLDMSAFYLDVIKDTLYTEKAGSEARRSIQTVLYHIAHALIRLLVPILAYTTEEIYQYLPKPSDSPVSVMLLDMPQIDESIKDDALMAKWQKFFEYRDEVSKVLEDARRNKTVGHSLDAAISIKADADAYQLLSTIKDDLCRLFIVSQVKLEQSLDIKDIDITVSVASGSKCSRCWIYSESIGRDEHHPELCARCAQVLA